MSAVIVLKKLVPLHVCDSWCTKYQFFGDTVTLFEKCEGSPNSKHDNFVCLCSHLNRTRLHHGRRIYRTLKHHYLCSNEAIDKTQLFSMNQLALTRVELKFYVVMLWNEVYSMPLCVKAQPAASVVIMMWWGIL